MIDPELEKEILNSIATDGSSLPENAPIQTVIANKTHLDRIVERSSGLPRLRHSILNKFVLILNQPLAIRAISPLGIRCCLCSKVISYPCWYYSVSYAVNHFHYFICFDRNSHNRPNVKCYRRSF